MFNTLWVVATKARNFILAAVRNMSEEERRELALTLIEKKLDWVVAHNLTLFKELGRTAAVRLVSQGHAEMVCRNLAVFALKDHEKDILFKLCIERKQGWALVHALRDLPLTEVSAKRLINAGYERLVGEHLALFKGYTEQQFHTDRFAWQTSFDLRRAPGHRYKA